MADIRKPRQQQEVRNFQQRGQRMREKATLSPLGPAAPARRPAPSRPATAPRQAVPRATTTTVPVPSVPTTTLIQAPGGTMLIEDPPVVEIFMDEKGNLQRRVR